MVKFVNYYNEKRNIRMRILSLALTALLMVPFSGYQLKAQNLRDAVRIYDNSMFSRSRSVFDGISEGSVSSDPEGFSVLSQVRSSAAGYEAAMDSFIRRVA